MLRGRAAHLAPTSCDTALAFALLLTEPAVAIADAEALTEAVLATAADLPPPRLELCGTRVSVVIPRTIFQCMRLPSRRPRG